MVKTVRSFLVFCLIFIFVCSFNEQKKMAKENIDIQGKWKSKAPEKAGEGESLFIVKEYRFLNEFWQIDYILYQDKELLKPVFKFQGEGSYEIEGISDKVDDAYNGIFKISKKYITILTDNEDMIKTFGFDMYKFEKGQRMDISESGCSFIPAVTECDKEYDIVKIEGNELYLGKRPEDNNITTPDRRPVKLGVPLVKQ